MNLIACPICKTIFPRENTLCENCSDQLWRAREPVVRDEGDLRIRSLFSWREGGPQALDWLIRSLKAKDEPAHWTELSLWMLTTFIQPQSPLQLPLLVPVPSKRQHALGLSRSLKQWTKWPLETPLSQVSSGWQKGLSRVDRRRVEFHSRGVDCRLYKTVLIVDDVVTTGATLKAAYHALGRPRNCEAWCLMDRRPCAR